MSIRAKFVVQSVTDFNTGTSGDTLRQVKLSAVTRGDGDPEDFWKYTPAGTLDITVSYPDTAEQFTPGKAFYLDFTEADA